MQIIADDINKKNNLQIIGDQKIQILWWLATIMEIFLVYVFIALWLAYRITNSIHANNF